MFIKADKSEEGAVRALMTAIDAEAMLEEDISGISRLEGDGGIVINPEVMVLLLDTYREIIEMVKRRLEGSLPDAMKAPF